MSDICKSTGINIEDHFISNHSGRKTGVTILKSNGASDSEVMALSRHKIIKGLAAYKRPREVLQEISSKNLIQAISNITQSNKIGKYKLILF